MRITLSDRIGNALAAIDNLPIPPRYYSGKIRSELLDLKAELKNKINETREKVFDLKENILNQTHNRILLEQQMEDMSQIDDRLNKLPYGYCELVTKAAKAAGVVIAGVASYAIQSGAIQLAVPAALNFFSGNSTATNP